jgi:ElaB/YqjD/DUF883 family membrane-anchored ribosome-binding protein
MRFGALEPHIHGSSFMSGAGMAINDDELDELDADIEETVADLEDSVSALAEELKDTADVAMQRVLRRIEDTVGDLYDLIADQTSRSVETIEQTIEERPWTSLLAAFGAGVIVAKLLSRGR